MRRSGFFLVILCSLAAPALARHSVSWCGTTPETGRENLFLHRQRMRAAALRPRAVTPTLNRDVGNIALIEDGDGVVARQNQFNLGGMTLRFTPLTADAARYGYAVRDQGYDAAAADAGTPLAALDDDDSRAMALPFTFPFFGGRYNQVFVNSDGNLTFTSGDSASSERSLGRMTAGPPRISPLFDDLDPALTAGGVRMLSTPQAVVVSWVSVPEWMAQGVGTRQTFQVKLYPDGRIEFSYSEIAATEAVVGIAPGNLQGTATLVDFRNDASGEYSSSVAERFGSTLSVDVVLAAQKFYQTHEDSYDYLVMYNNEDISAMSQAVAFEDTVRTSGTGFGSAPQDTGRQYGSASRLQSLLNMGYLGQYPRDPNGPVPARRAQGDTPLTAVAHEAGHLFLARVSVRDPADPAARPMLNPNNLVHWGFVFNSEASLLEGERIVDRGTATAPEFLTTDTVQAYSPLDRYLMGFAPFTDVPPSFWVDNAPANLRPLLPYRNIAFDGTRRNVTIQDIVAAEGRRTPDSTVAQRRFRFAFILIIRQGSQPAATDISQVDTYRQQFETFFAQASGNLATADTSLKRSLKLSLFPSAGVVAGGAGSATLSVQTAPTAPLTVQLQAGRSYTELPASVTIPAGATSAAFSFTGRFPGVEEVTAVPGDPAYETAAARLQVAGASSLKLLPVSGDHQISSGAAPLPEPIVVRLTDANNLAYPGARIQATVSTGGSVTPAVAVADGQGLAEFRWTPGSAQSSQLTLAVEAAPSVEWKLSAGSGVPVVSTVMNAASFADGIAAGALGALKGVHLTGGSEAGSSYPWPVTLAGVRVLLNGAAVPLLYVSDTQVNFYVPPETAIGTATLTVVTASGAEASARAEVTALQPGIFTGGVLRAGTGMSALTTPVRAGDYLEIYCTGLGATQNVGGLQETVVTPTVFIGAVPVQPVYSGISSGIAGFYQINVQVPAGLAPGRQPLVVSISLEHSNEAAITVQ